jgi:hypothetical protein
MEIINSAKCRYPKENTPRLNINGKTITDPIEITTAFNNYFIDNINSIHGNNNNANKMTNNFNSIFMTPTIPFGHNVI